MAHSLLDGLRVVELAGGLGAAYCGRLLADAGAEVIAVEPPEGSGVRRLAPFVHDEPGVERGLVWLYSGVNKRSVTLNLHSEEGRDLFLRLLGRADALVEDAALGELEALGIDDDRVAAARPGLVWTSISAFGQTGPYRDYAASAITLQALCGWLGLSGAPDREPVQTGGRLAEMAPGLLAAVATLGELLDLEEDGDLCPRRADLSSFELLATLHSPFELGWSYRGAGPARRMGNRLPSTHPFTVIRCKDGYVGIVHLTHTQWEMICRMMGIEHLLADPELQTGLGRVANADRIDAAMEPWLAAHTVEEVFHTGQAWRIPFAPVVTAADLYASPQHAARGWLTPLTHPEAGAYRAPGPAFDPIGIERCPDRAAPALGRDNVTVFGELGLRPDDLAELREAGAI